MEGYPKRFTLNDGREIIIRPLIKEDKEKLVIFFSKIPANDILYLRDDVTKRETIEKWINNLNYERVLPLIAETKDEIIGDATLHRKEQSWTRYTGEIRLVVHPLYRRKGVGSLLAREIFFQALKGDLRKLVAEMMADQKEARRVFEKLGFKEEAILKSHVIDAKGKTHDLLIMSNDVEMLWNGIKSIEEDITSSQKE